VFEHTKGLKDLNMKWCNKITGKKFLGKFFADQSSGKFPGCFFLGDIKVFEHTKQLKDLNMIWCNKITGKKFLGKFFADQYSGNVPRTFLNR
jgi:hypothetical protein